MRATGFLGPSSALATGSAKRCDAMQCRTVVFRKRWPRALWACLVVGIIAALSLLVTLQALSVSVTPPIKHQTLQAVDFRESDSNPLAKQSGRSSLPPGCPGTMRIFSPLQIRWTSRPRLDTHTTPLPALLPHVSAMADARSKVRRSDIRWLSRPHQVHRGNRHDHPAGDPAGAVGVLRVGVAGAARTGRARCASTICKI